MGVVAAEGVPKVVVLKAPVKAKAEDKLKQLPVGARRRRADEEDD